MNQEQTFASLDAMLENPKAKTFLNHLVRSYMPVTNVSNVLDKPKGDFKCVLTRDQLISVNDIKSNIKDEKLNAMFVSDLDKAFSDKAFSDKSEVEKLIGSTKLGVSGKDTTTFMSYTALQDFYDWLILKSVKEKNPHINWLMGSIRRETLIGRAENIQDAELQKKVSDFKKANGKKASFTLGDSSDFLSKLKAELESNGK